MKEILKERCILTVVVLFLITLGSLLFTHYEMHKTKQLIGEVEYYDSVNTYNKIYYEESFNTLKRENKKLYDSLKGYKNQISYLVQFKHEKHYNTGIISSRPIIKDTTSTDTMFMKIPKVAKTYEYSSEPNDTFQYKLNVNSYTEPNWFSLQANVKNKFTIVNKEENGVNHISIGSENGGKVSSVTVFKKKEKRTFWNRFSFGPSVSIGYDPINNKFGTVVGLALSFDLK